MIIGILAAITTVAYNGIQTRAKNQQTVSAVRSYYNALVQYGIETGAYPNTYGCLGRAVDYPTTCYQGAASYTYNSTLNTTLLKHVPSPPSLVTTQATNSGATITGAGILYHNSATFGGYYMGFVIYNATDCPSIAGAQVPSNSALNQDMYCRINLPPIS